MNRKQEFTIEALRSAGFEGFARVGDVRTLGGLDSIPADAGIYAVVREASSDPKFAQQSVGGRFKGRNPTQPIQRLQTKWVPEAQVLYVGRSDSLRKRIKQLADFGAGRPVGHWGGRFLWQLADPAELLVAWRTCRSGETPAAAEIAFIERFVSAYGCLPFANIAWPSQAAA